MLGGGTTSTLQVNDTHLHAALSTRMQNNGYACIRGNHMVAALSILAEGNRTHLDPAGDMPLNSASLSDSVN